MQVTFMVLVRNLFFFVNILINLKKNNNNNNNKNKKQTNKLNKHKNASRTIGPLCFVSDLS